MELYTVVEKNENATKVLGGIYLEKKEYPNKQVKKFIDVAKYYYVKIYTETESTDFNDRYSDSWTNYIGCNFLNVVIKDDEVYGFIANGLGRDNDDFVVLTFEKRELKLIDGSVYSSVDKTFTLCEYDLPEEALDLVQNIRITRSYKCFKLKDDKEKLDIEGSTTYFLNAFDCIISEGEVLGVKCCDRTFMLADETTFIQDYIEEKVHGSMKYRYYYHIELNKI